MFPSWSPALLSLRAAFLARGFDIRAVGGCVRDWLKDQVPEDINLCTDATPEEQQALYVAAGVRHYDTGLAHGTWTVLLDGRPVEITSLRTETDHDGRRASVRYIRAWEVDLARRDLTINAMALTLDGVLHDPHGGADDLRRGIVRCVGHPTQRFEEDFLRILRLVRFHGRYSHSRHIRAEEAAAIRWCAPGLRGISRERVWSEMQRIIAGPSALEMLSEIIALGVAPHIDLPVPTGWRHRLETAALYTDHPVTRMAAYLGSDRAMEQIATEWRWSTADAQLGLSVASHLGRLDLARAKWLIAVAENPVLWYSETFLAQGDHHLAEALTAWRVPVFPVSGADLIGLGYAPGKALGQRLQRLRHLWGQSDYTMSQEALLAVPDATPHFATSHPLS